MLIKIGGLLWVRAKLEGNGKKEEGVGNDTKC